MKKILVVHSSGSISGGEIISKYIYDYLKNDFLFYFFVPAIKDNSKFSNNDNNVFYQKKEGLLNKIKSLKQYIKQNKPDIINAHGTRAAIFVKLVLLTTRKNFKFFYTIHGFHLAHKKGIKNRIFLFLENLTNFLFVDNLICVGLSDYNLVLKNTWTKKSVILIKNGVEKPIKKENKEIEKIKDNSKFIILTICRLHYQKDVTTLIKAVSLLNNDIKLVIIGDGPQRKELEDLLNKINNNNILFLGNINEASALIHYFDSFILSTHWEGLPLVLLEAMLSDVLSIGSNVHGIRDLIKNGETGFLFKEGDENDLAEKIKEALYCRDKKEYIVNNAHNFVQKEYSINNMITEYRKLYDKL